MEKAFLIKENKIATVQEVIAEYGIEVTRALKYLCEDEHCRVRVYPSIPMKKKRGRLVAPSPYFSNRGSVSHKRTCRVGMRKTKQPPLWVKLPDIDSNVISTITDIPTRFIEDLPILEYRRKIRRSPRGKLYSKKSKKNSRKRRYRYNPRTRELKNLVRIFETFPKKVLSSTPLKISSSPATTYLNALRNMNSLEKNALKNKQTSKLIYHGLIDFVVRLPQGLLIYFKETSKNNRQITVLLKKSNASQESKRQLWEKIKEAAAGNKTVFYSLGNFQLVEDGSLRLSTDELNKIWVSSPDDYINNRN